MDISHLHSELLENNSRIFVQTPDGVLQSMAQHRRNLANPWIQIYPGSFNPLHSGHKNIWELIQTKTTVSYFEISITNWDKPTLLIEELQQRLSQFTDFAPVIITNVSRFADKAGVLRPYFNSIKFHLGFDTFKKVLDHNGIVGMQGMAAEFVIHERITKGKHETFDGLTKTKKPSNCFAGPSNRSVESLSTSSTQIRNNNNP